MARIAARVFWCPSCGGPTEAKYRDNEERQAIRAKHRRMGFAATVYTYEIRCCSPDCKTEWECD